MPRRTPIAVSRAHLCDDCEMEITPGANQTDSCKKSQPDQQIATVPVMSKQPF